MPRSLGALAKRLGSPKARLHFCGRGIALSGTLPAGSRGRGRIWTIGLRRNGLRRGLHAATRLHETRSRLRAALARAPPAALVAVRHGVRCYSPPDRGLLLRIDVDRTAYAGL